jgi:hypothetical protein
VVLARGLDHRHARELGFPIRAAALDGLALLGDRGPLARVPLFRSLEHRHALCFEGFLVGRELGLLPFCSSTRVFSLNARGRSVMIILMKNTSLPWIYFFASRLLRCARRSDRDEWARCS